MCLVKGIGNFVRCPECGKGFVVEDLHRPFRCPRCGALLDYEAALEKVFAILRAEDMIGDEK